jgi:hypothetical protein
MMSKPIDQIAALTIGTVESVSPSEIRVVLEPNAPQTTALNTGVPTGFPRINGYVLIPNETGAVVGLVVWLGVERSQFPKRTGLKDFGLVDLPFPLRKISLTPLGTLRASKRNRSGENAYRLERGVSAFPSVGDAAQLPTAEQLRSIIEASNEEDRRVKIGTSPLAANAAVTIDPDKIFARHLAVLGNTGSGKSCTVAGIIRWSLEKARNERAQLLKAAVDLAKRLDDPEKESEALRKHGGPPNARFIILDPNGEYSSAFADDPNVRRFRVPPVKDPFRPLLLPAWMWNSHEWCAFTEASSKVQRPILMRALRELRVIGDGEREDADAVPLRLRRFYHSLIKDKSQGPSAYMDFPGKQNFGQKIRALYESVGVLSENQPEHKECLLTLQGVIWQVMCSKPPNAQGFYPAFDDRDIENLVDAFDKAIRELPISTERLRVSEDSPVRFDVAELADVIEQIATEQGQVQFVDTLVLRIRMLLSDERLSAVVSSGLICAHGSRMLSVTIHPKLVISQSSTCRYCLPTYFTLSSQSSPVLSLRQHSDTVDSTTRNYPRYWYLKKLTHSSSAEVMKNRTLPPLPKCAVRPLNESHERAASSDWVSFSHRKDPLSCQRQFWPNAIRSFCIAS